MGFVSNCALLNVLLTCLMDPVSHCYYLTGRRVCFVLLCLCFPTSSSLFYRYTSFWFVYIFESCGIIELICIILKIPSRKHAYIMLTLSNPVLYSKNRVYMGIHYAQKQRLWVLGEAVLTRTHNLCFGQKYEKISEFLSENFHF